MLIYPVPQNAPYVSAGMNVPNIPEGQRPKATDVSPWYGVYLTIKKSRSSLALGVIDRTLSTYFSISSPET